MKTKQIISILGLLSVLGSQTVAVAQGTAFTYQGRLDSGGAPYTGNAEFQPTLWDAPSGGSQLAANTPTQVAVAVTNGLFMLPLDFGANFPGADRWLQLEVRTTIGPFTLLSPRQKLAPTPYAITAGNLSGPLPATQLTGTLPGAVLAGSYPGAVTLSNPANSFTGSGAGLTGLNASALTSGTVPDGRLAANVARTNQVWLLSGNAGTTAGTHFLGTADNRPLEIKVNGLRALRLEPNTSGAPNLIAGSPRNFVGAGVVGATIAGGGATNYLGLSSTNSVLSDFGVVGGGRRNTIAVNSTNATIAGGYNNDIGTNSPYSAIGGGYDNNIAADSPYATIAGGYNNDIDANSWGSAIGGGYDNTIATNSWSATIAGGLDNDIGTKGDYSAIGGGNGNNIAANSSYATIAGGGDNDIGTNADYSTIGGGAHNQVATTGAYATIPGGRDNFANSYAFAAGRRAKANHSGAFVWGDSTDANIASINANSVTMRGSGGYWLFSNSGTTAGVRLAAGGSSWTSISDRNAKEHFAPVDAEAVLAKVVSLPIATWNYKSQDPAIRHIGPVAQDFYAAFGVGESDTGITSIDADGVALAAIQGLNQRLTEELKRRDAENAELRQRLARLEQVIQLLTK